MENFKLIDFQLTRDFSNKLNATFAFINQNYKALFRSILYISGPPVLVASLLLSTTMRDVFGLSMQASRNPGNTEAFSNLFAGPNFWIQMALMFVFFMVSYVITTATLNNYLILYQEKKSNQIEVSEVWARVRDTFWMYLGTTLLFGILVMIAYVLLVIPVVVLVNISPLLVFFGVILMIGGIFYLIVGASLIYVIRAFEKKDFFTSLRRSFYLIQGKWWSTFGLYMILSLIVGTISSMFFVPAYVVMMIDSIHNIESTDFQGPTGFMGTFVMIFMTLYYLSQIVLSCLPNIGLAFQYFNLVEMKEAKGLMGQIENLGQPKSIPPPEEHY